MSNTTIPPNAPLTPDLWRMKAEAPAGPAIQALAEMAAKAPAFIDEDCIANCLLPTKVFDHRHQVHVMFPTGRAEYIRAADGTWELVALQGFAPEHPAIALTHPDAKITTQA